MTVSLALAGRVRGRGGRAHGESWLPGLGRGNNLGKQPGPLCARTPEHDKSTWWKMWRWLCLPYSPIKH